MSDSSLAPTMSTDALVGYSVISQVPTVSTVDFADATTTASTSTSTSISISTPTTSSDQTVPTTPSETTNSVTSVATLTTTTSTPSTLSAQPAISTPADAVYRQILDAGALANIGWTHVVAADFNQLCPSGDCVQDCQNSTRLFEQVPYLIDQPFETYGKAVGAQPPSITLFGVCSNLANVYAGLAAGTGIEAKASYFPQDSLAGVDDVSATIASCLMSTCDAARNPENCMTSCNMTALYGGGDGSNLTAMTQCLTVLCGNTCGLPYANQDVMGVGVLVSYIIQALLVLLCAVGLIAWAASLVFRPKQAATKSPPPTQTTQPQLSITVRRGLEGFLAAQCYFTIALETAALVLDPWHVDPLTGYALLSVGITGFLCPVFTLMLLHSQSCRSWYLGLLTVISYVLASVTFWALYATLTHHVGTTGASDATLRQLYEISSCGDSSAIALCPQTVGNDPLEYLAKFYNQNGIPNLHTMPLLWGWATLMLLVLVVNQLRYAIGLSSQGQQSQTVTTARQKRSGLAALTHALVRILGHPIALLVASTLFGLALGYQARMLQQYARSDVIDWSGWTFGQVVAVVIWVQPIADYTHLWIREHRDRASNQNNTTQQQAGMLQLANSGGKYTPLSQGHSYSSSLSQPPTPSTPSAPPTASPPMMTVVQPANVAPPSRQSLSQPPVQPLGSGQPSSPARVRTH